MGNRTTRLLVPDNHMQQICLNLSIARIESKLTIAAIASACKVSEQTIKRLESALYWPKLNRIKNICLATDTDPQTIFMWEHSEDIASSFKLADTPFTLLVCANLKRLRAKQNVTQKQLAQRIGMTVTNYNAIENGKYGPRVDYLLAVLKTLNEQPSELFYQE